MSNESKEALCGFLMVGGAVAAEWAMHDWRSALVLLIYFIGATWLADLSMST